MATLVARDDPGATTTDPNAPTTADPNAPTTTPANPPGGVVTQGDLDGAAERFAREGGGQWDVAAGMTAYNAARAAGQDHETAYQTAKAQVQAQAAQSSTPNGNSPSAPTSPVTSTGGIPPPAPVAPPTPQAVGAQPDARTPTATAASPTYTPYQYNATLAPAQTLATYNPATFQNTLAPSSAAPAAYAGTTLSQFASPDQSATNAQQSALMSSILQNPETLSPSVVAQMQEAQKEQALLLGQQNNAQYAQNAVGRGALNSGQTSAFQANNLANTNNSILTGNRNVDLQAAATNRQDQLNALTASSGLAQDQLSRAAGAYNTTLQGQQAQATNTQAAQASAVQNWLNQNSQNLSTANYGLGVSQANAAQQLAAQQSQATSQSATNANNLASAQFNLGQQQAQASQNQAGYTSQETANTDAFNRALSLAQNAQSTYGQDLANQLAQNSANLDVQKFLAQQSQFGQSLGYNYDQLGQTGNQNQTNALLSAIMGS